MDPASALGVASAVIAFIEFSTELISGACEIYKSLDGKTDENAHIELIVEDLSRASRSLSIPSSTVDGARTAYEKDIIALSTKCQKKCDALYTIFTQLRPKSKSTWSSFRSAWMSRRKQGDIAGIYSELRDYRSAMLLRMSQRHIESDCRLEAKISQLVSNLRLQDTQDTSVTNRIMKQLYFDALYSREDGIKRPDGDTFDWILSEKALQEDAQVPRTFVAKQQSARQQFRSQYLAWLDGSSSSSSPSSSALHISGKAGSGKSTLMRHLFKSGFTKERVQAWAGRRKLIQVSFYFWMASGNHQQTSAEGLYRTVLYKALQQCPEIAAYLFPEQWKTMRYSSHDDGLDATLFRKDALAAAMERLTAIDAVSDVPYVLVLYIDGLDEHEEKESDWGSGTADRSESHKALARDIVRWGRARHVKICTSARPYAEFLDIFERAGGAILLIYTSTVCDIYRCAKSMFEADDCFDEFEPSAHLRLCSDIARMSEGVFVWAILTVRLMVVSLSLGDSTDTQDAKLNAMPARINDLYTLLLDQVADEGRERSNQLLLFLHHSFSTSSDGERLFYDRLHLHWVPWLIRLAEPDFLKDPVICTPYTAKQLAQRRSIGRRLLSRLTKGIVEVEADRARGSPGDIIIGFCHRTVRDYVQMRVEQGLLTSSALDFQTVDVYGMIHLANFIYVSPSPLHATFSISNGHHPNSCATMVLHCNALAKAIQSGALYEGGPSFAHGSGDELFGFKTRLDMAFQGAGNDAFGPTETRPPTRIPAISLPAYLLLQSDKAMQRYNYGREPWSTPLSSIEKTLVMLNYMQKGELSIWNMARYCEGFERCFHGCNTAAHGLPVPPWMVMLGHFMDSLYLGWDDYSERHRVFDFIVPPEARSTTTITFIGCPPTTIGMDAVSDFIDSNPSPDQNPRPRHILSIDYGEHHLSGDFRYYVTCLPEESS